MRNKYLIFLLLFSGCNEFFPVESKHPATVVFLDGKKIHCADYTVYAYSTAFCEMDDGRIVRNLSNYEVIKK